MVLYCAVILQSILQIIEKGFSYARAKKQDEKN